MPLKVGATLSFLAGFNEFESTTSVVALARGVSPDLLTWKVFDGAERVFLSLSVLVVFS